MAREIKTIAFGTADYYKAVDLRDRILRKPLGLVFTKEFLAQDTTDHIIGLFDDDKIIAVLHLKPLDDETMKMRQVAVDSRFQRQRLGKKLVEYSEQFAKNMKYKTFILHARDSAVKFYKSMNYKIEGKQFEEVGIPHYKMRKDL